MLSRHIMPNFVSFRPLMIQNLNLVIVKQLEANVKIFNTNTTGQGGQFWERVLVVPTKPSPLEEAHECTHQCRWRGCKGYPDPFCPV